MRYTTELTDESRDQDTLAEVIPLPRLENQSFYQRNSGALPRIGQRSLESNRRAFLPSPDYSESEGFFTRIMDRLTSR